MDDKELKRISNTLLDHEKRLQEVEKTKAVDELVHKNITETLEVFKNDMRETFIEFKDGVNELKNAIETRFATKNDLELLKKDFDSKIEKRDAERDAEGPWKTRFIALMTSIATFVIITVLALILPQAS